MTKYSELPALLGLDGVINDDREMHHKSTDMLTIVNDRTGEVRRYMIVSTLNERASFRLDYYSKAECFELGYALTRNGSET